jgi:hypothetical protein
VGGLGLLVQPASAATGYKTLASYQMNETSGSVLVDSSGHGLNGKIGSHVLLNGSYHTFPDQKVRALDPQRIDTVASSQLDPGTRNFTVTVRFKTTRPEGNILQKGQSGATPPGMYKVQLDDGGGRVLCSFISANGSASVWSSNTVTDGQWHVVTCTRTAHQATVTVDGVVRGTINHSTGTIASKLPLSIGGKSSCTQTKGHWCDYFWGSIDYVVIQSS